MHIAVISDLHLGAGGAADAFGHDDTKFLRFLRHLEDNFEKIVLLGDIWETLTGLLPANAFAQWDAARAAHPEIAKRFERPEYSFVHGNHDIIAAARGVPEELVIEVDGLRLLFTHGHQNDLIVRRARWLSELGVWLGAWIRRIGLSPLYHLLQKLDGLRGGATTSPDTCSFQRWAVDQARRKSADVVVTGHTHLAALAEHGDRLFLNSGSCAMGAVSFLAIDTRGGKFGVHRSW